MNESQKEERRVLMNLMAFVALLIFIGVTAHTVVTNPNNYLLSSFGKDETVVPVDVLLITFIVLHHVRLWFGINFIHYDESFGNAITAVARQDKEAEAKIWKTQFRLMIGLLLTTGLFLIVLKGGFYGLRGMVFFLALQSIILIMYNVLFYKVMYIEDKQKGANIFIGIGDLVIVIFTIMLATYAFLYNNNPDANIYSSTSFSVILGALASIFIGESISQYLPAFLIMVKKSVKAAF